MYTFLLFFILETITLKDVGLIILFLISAFYVYKVGVPEKLSKGYKDLYEAKEKELQESKRIEAKLLTEKETLEEENKQYRREIFQRIEFHQEDVDTIKDLKDEIRKLVRELKDGKL